MRDWPSLKNTLRGPSSGAPGSTVFIEQPSNQPIDPHDGEPDLQGIGFFIRFGFADRETNPLLWAVSGGIGGRGVVPFRDNDTFGIGYYYNSGQSGMLLGILGVEDSAQGFELFYNIAITPACRVTLDLQVVKAPLARLDTATVVGLRASLEF